MNSARKAQRFNENGVPVSSIDPVLRMIRESFRSLDQVIFTPGRVRIVTLILCIFLLRGCWLFATRHSSTSTVEAPDAPASARSPLQVELIDAQRISADRCRLNLRVHVDPQRRGDLSILLFKSIATAPASRIELNETNVFRLGAQRVGIAPIELKNVPSQSLHFELIGVAQIMDDRSQSQLIEQRVAIQLPAYQTEKGPPASPPADSEVDGPPK